MYGIAPVLGALRANRRQLHCLVVQEHPGDSAQRAEADEILQLAYDADIPITYMPGKVMTHFLG